MERTDTVPDAYIDGLPEDVREDMTELDHRLSRVFSHEPRFMWEGRFWGGSDQSIIGYGEFSYTNSSGREVRWFAVGLAAQKQYISVYVNAVEDGAYLLRQYDGRLGKVKIGSASLSFRSLDDLEIETFEELIIRARDLIAGP